MCGKDKAIASIFFLLMFIVLFTDVGRAQAPAASAGAPGVYLSRWLVCGPFALEKSMEESTHLPGFETDFLSGIGGETRPRIEEGSTIVWNGQKGVWRGVERAGDKISLDQALSQRDYVVGYAWTEVESDSDRFFLLGLRTNDGGRLWLNGERIWDLPSPRGLNHREVLLPVLLQKGKNSLLLKIEERLNLWEFAARLSPLDLKKQAADYPLCRISVSDKGEAELDFVYGRQVWQTMIEKADLTLIDGAGGGKIYSRRWEGQPRTGLLLPSPDYRPYALQVDLHLRGYGPIRQEIRFHAGARQEYRLFDHGQTEYVISLTPEASASEQWAAKELQKWLGEIGGVTLPIVVTGEKSPEKSILLGYSRRAAKCLGLTADPPAGSDESFRYGNCRATLAIVGGAGRGTMYGVSTFLEKEFGMRWYTPSVNSVPRKSEYVFTHLYRQDKPGIRVRNDFYFEAFDPLWAARNKMNGRLTFEEQLEQPGGVESYWSVHTFFPLVPPEEFFATHPEYYSLIDGKRKHERAQLCLTNPDVLRIVIERIRQRMRQSPQHLIYDVSQNDWYGACQCESCQAIARREESESGPVVWFVNRVAEAIEKEFPEKFIGTLAYQYTRKPCKMLKPRPNVVVRLCSIECCFSHDFHSCAENRSFLADLEGWARIAPHLYIWDYVVNFSHYLLPYPNLRVLKNNIRTFRDNHAIGIMEQAAYQSRGGELAELRAYLISRLLWNPEADERAVIDDFLFGYYGRSGQYVKAYLEWLHDRIGPDTHIHLGLDPDDKLFNDEFLIRAEDLFDRAEAVAESEEVLRRVEMARLPILYLKCKRYPVRARYDGTYSRFCRIAEREGITHYAESGKTHRESFHRQVLRAGESEK